MDEILIEGYDDFENDEQVRMIEAGHYDLSDQSIEGWFSKLKSVVKSVTKPITKSLSPVLKIAKDVTSIPVLSNLIPGSGMVKFGVGLFDDLQKIEKKTRKKIRFTPKAVKNYYNAAYLKGYKNGRADEAKEHQKITNTSYRYSNNRSRTNSNNNANSRFARR